MYSFFHSKFTINVYLYGKFHVCERGFSEEKSEASNRATNFGLAQISNFLYTVLCAFIPVIR